ncbi:MAG: hypothetical protein AAF198_09400 [Pseudomonadota bacterium]
MNIGLKGRGKDAAEEAALPPKLDLDQVDPQQAWRVIDQGARLWFEPGAKTLIISFDNLATLDTHHPRYPWLYKQLKQEGYALLGVQSDAKNWFRLTPVPDLLRALTSHGFFDNFDRIVMIGASMGGFGALAFAPLVPGADVLCFSPQTSMSKQICPFEARFPYAVRNSDWTKMPYLDAASATPYIPKVAVFYDPFVLEDKLHAERLQGKNVRHMRVPHFSHEAIRMVMKTGALSKVIRSFVQTADFDATVFVALRNRRLQRKWCRQMISDLQTRDRVLLTLWAAENMLQRENYLFAAQAKSAALERLM